MLDKKEQVYATWRSYTVVTNMGVHKNVLNSEGKWRLSSASDNRTHPMRVDEDGSIVLRLASYPAGARPILFSYDKILTE